jgi:hypothetical protein
LSSLLFPPFACVLCLWLRPPADTNTVPLLTNTRQIFSTLTTGSSPVMLNASANIWSESLAAISNVTGIVWSLVYEPMPPLAYNRAAAGTDVLGLSGQTENLMVMLLTSSWDNAADDALVDATVRSVIGGIESSAKALGEFNEWEYLNYAGTWQDPVSTYGESNVEFLRRVSAIYDPRGVFQRLVPGGFKLPK